LFRGQFVGKTPAASKCFNQKISSLKPTCGQSVVAPTFACEL
jgi:hypothetical protein